MYLPVLLVNNSLDTIFIQSVLHCSYFAWTDRLRGQTWLGLVYSEGRWIWDGTQEEVHILLFCYIFKALSLMWFSIHLIGYKHDMYLLV